MSTTTKVIEQSKSWWNTIKDSTDDALHFTKETGSVAWEIAKDNKVATIILMGGGFALANKAWFPAAILSILGTASVALNEFNKTVIKEQTKAAFMKTWKVMDSEQRVAFIKTAMPDLSDEDIAMTITAFNLECGE